MEERTLIEYDPRNDRYDTYLGFRMEADELDDSYDYYEVEISNGSIHYAVVECTNIVIDYFTDRDELIEAYGE